MGSRNLEMVKRFWEIWERDGMTASAEAMLACCHPDVELSPYAAGQRVLRGADEIRSFWQQRLSEGKYSSSQIDTQTSAWSFKEDGDEVIVSGSVRVQHADGSLADAQVRWTYGFKDGLVARATSAPLTG